MARKILFPLILAFLLVASVRPELVRSQGEPHRLFIPLFNNNRLQPPVLKWQYGGCYDTWCETGWYSSPAVADVNGDGVNEVIASAYSLWALDGQTGQLLWRRGSTSHRTWPGVVVADIDLDGEQEIVIAQSGGWVSVYRLDGTPKWQVQPSGGVGEFRGLLVADLDGNGSSLEVIVTRAYGSARNTWVLEANGDTRAGWPQLPQDDDNPTGYAWGVYNSNAAAGNLDSEAPLELVVPSDVHYINIYKPDGTPILANQATFPGRYWGQVGVWESEIPEKRGWGLCNGPRSESYRTNFAKGPAVIADVNGDGQREVVVTGNMYDCYRGYPPSRYMALFVFNPDRTRFRAGDYDWTTIPIDTGKPLSENYNKIENVVPNPVVADLDGDGIQEILYASYDGRLHAFWLDKTEHGDWPFSVYKPAEGFLRFASEPLVADLQGDGRMEVMFTSWTQKGSRHTGKLYFVDGATGRLLVELGLPKPLSSSPSWNGALAAPTLANIDQDPELELVINTAYSGVVVYDLPGTAGARILWGTGRGSFRRDGMR